MRHDGKVFKRFRRQRALAKVKPGDGRALKPYRWWHSLWRTLFVADLQDEDDHRHEYAVDINYLSFAWDAALYRDGRREATSELPAVFPVPGGVVEVATTFYGLKRMHLVTDDGREQQLRPHRLSSEGMRMRFGRRFPRASTAISWTAVAVLLTSLAVLFLPTVASISRIDVVAEHLGTYTAPYTLPGWLSTTLTISGLVAALERALTLRNHWLIDADTWWMGG